MDVVKTAMSLWPVLVAGITFVAWIVTAVLSGRNNTAALEDLVTSVESVKEDTGEIKTDIAVLKTKQEHSSAEITEIKDGQKKSVDLELRLGAVEIKLSSMQLMMRDGGGRDA